MVVIGDRSWQIGHHFDELKGIVSKNVRSRPPLVQSTFGKRTLYDVFSKLPSTVVLWKIDLLL